MNETAAFFWDETTSHRLHKLFPFHVSLVSSPYPLRNSRHTVCIAPIERCIGRIRV